MRRGKKTAVPRRTKSAAIPSAPPISPDIPNVMSHPNIGRFSFLRPNYVRERPVVDRVLEDVPCRIRGGIRRGLGHPSRGDVPHR